MEKQPEESPTPYASMITKQMGLMDFRKSAQELERLVRGMNPWPSAYTFLNGKTFKIWEASVVSVLNGDGKPSAAPGTVIAADSDREGIHVACGKGHSGTDRGPAGGKETYGRSVFPQRISGGAGNSAERS